MNNTEIPAGLILPPNYVYVPRDDNTMLHGFLLPPEYILSDTFIGSYQFKEYTTRRYEGLTIIPSNLWTSVILQISYDWKIPYQSIPKFCRSIKALGDEDKFNRQDLNNILLYIEGITDIPKSLLEDNFINKLSRKYNYSTGPYVFHDGCKYSMLTDYDRSSF